MSAKQCDQPVESEGNHDDHSPQVKFKFTSLARPHFTASSSHVELTWLTLSGQHPESISMDKIVNAQLNQTSFLREMKKILMIWKRFVKKPTKENIILLVGVGVAFLLWFWTIYAPGGFNYMPPSGLKSVFAFLSASFNNVPTRVLHFSALVTLVSAFLPSLIQGKIGPLLGNIQGVVALTRKIISYQKSQVFNIMIISLGAGLFFSNFMMRNNSINKYFACFTVGMMIMMATSGMFNSTFVRLCKGLFYDVAKMFRYQSYLSKYQIALQLGFGGGLIMSIISSVIRDVFNNAMTDSIGYILGMIIMGTGLVLSVMAQKQGQKI